MKALIDIWKGRLMAGEPTISIVGNVGSDAEMKLTPNGYNVTSFSIAVTPRNQKSGEWSDGETMWFRCFVWGENAPAAAVAIRKGQKLFVDGRFKITSYATKEGEARNSNEITVDKYGVVPPKIAEPVIAPVSNTTEEPADDFPW
jgi:single-strand DNA-binding protein